MASAFELAMAGAVGRVPPGGDDEEQHHPQASERGRKRGRVRFTTWDGLHEQCLPLIEESRAAHVLAPRGA